MGMWTRFARENGWETDTGRKKRNIGRDARRRYDVRASFFHVCNAHAPASLARRRFSFFRRRAAILFFHSRGKYGGSGVKKRAGKILPLRLEQNFVVFFFLIIIVTIATATITAYCIIVTILLLISWLRKSRGTGRERNGRWERARARVSEDASWSSASDMLDTRTIPHK